MQKLKSILMTFMTALLVGCNTKAASVGIIGGADGPTAIFVTSKLNKEFWTVGIGLGIILLVVIAFLIKHKKR